MAHKRPVPSTSRREHKNRFSFRIGHEFPSLPRSAIRGRSRASYSVLVQLCAKASPAEIMLLVRANLLVLWRSKEGFVLPTFGAPHISRLHRLARVRLILRTLHTRRGLGCLRMTLRQLSFLEVFLR